MTTGSEAARRYNYTITRDGAVALEFAGIDQPRLDQLRRLLEGHLGPGFIAAIDGEIVARGPGQPGTPVWRGTVPLEEALQLTQRLTEMAVQQHEYCYAELQRIRRDYEEEFAQERAILRALRQKWIERVCDDSVRGEDALRFLVESVRKAGAQVQDEKQG